MTSWIYKCNARQHPRWVYSGNWRDFFEGNRATEWGSTENVPDLARLKIGARIIAYQTDRNELVGLARVKAWRSRGRFQDLILEPIERIGAKVRPLKREDPRVAKIPALQPGPIQTIYPISTEDAQRLLDAARDVPSSLAGAGFGSWEQNKRVEAAAVKLVTRSLRARGWVVKDVSLENRGYDLHCTKGLRTRHVEVKGASGSKATFPITANERRSWKSNPLFELALVTAALSNPRLTFFKGAADLRRFAFEPISFMASHI